MNRIDRAGPGSDIFVVHHEKKAEETRKRLFERTSFSVQKLSKQAHKELRVKKRAEWWAQHPERHPR